MKQMIMLFSLLGLVACGQAPATHHIELEALDSQWSIEYATDRDLQTTEQLKAEIINRLEEVNTTFSTQYTTSPISRFNATAESKPVKLSEEVSETVRMVKMVSELSGGCYRVTDKMLYDLWGFTEGSVKVPSTNQIAEAMKHVDGENLIAYGDFLRKTDAGITIDLSPIMLALGMEAVISMLEHKAIANYMIKAGSNIVYAGAKPDGSPWNGSFHVSLPGTKTLEKRVELLPGPAIVTATIERFPTEDGATYASVLDARTGKPVTHNTVAVTVNHADPARGMAWANALLCLGNKEGMTVATRSDIKASFFINENNQVVEQMSPALANVQSAQ